MAFDQGLTAFLWEEGLHPARARVELVPPRWITMLRDFDRLGGPTGDDRFDDGFSLRRRALSASAGQAEQQYQQYLSSYAVQELARGRWLAFGYGLSGEERGRPASLPREIWNGEVDWLEARASCGRLHAEQIRILTRFRADQLISTHRRRLDSAPRPEARRRLG